MENLCGRTGELYPWIGVDLRVALAALLWDLSLRDTIRVSAMKKACCISLNM